MKRMFAVICLLILMIAPIAKADEDPALVFIVELVQENVNLSNKDFNFYMNISKNSITDPNLYRIDFDWRDGNEAIRVMCNRSARVYNLYPVDTLEKIQCFLFLLNQFEEIEEILPQGCELDFRIWEADGTKIMITSDNYKSYLKKYQKMVTVSNN